MSAIVVDRLTRRFGDFTAVDAISFAVTAGEVFGFLGPNGAGKTTTIKMLTGLLQPTSGRAHVAGLDVATENAALRSRIGYMSQRFSLYDDLTVGENVAFFAGLYGVRGQRLAERRAWALQLAGLVDRDRLLTGDLPLGWKQRLALACAVLHDPPILFLDEPTSGVDPLARRAFWELIRALAQGGTTILVSTHYMEEAEHCDRLALMNRGRLVALDTPVALRTEFGQPIYEITTDDAPHATSLLQSAPIVEEASMFGRAVHAVLVQEIDAVEDQLRALLQDAGIGCSRVRRIPASLEDVFVGFVRREGGALVG